MHSLTELLEGFWGWSGINQQQYSAIGESGCVVEPFYYPYFNEMKDVCRQQINKNLDAQQMDDFLTCLGLDSEVEDILQWCKDTANTVFLGELVRAGCQHMQPEARWQIAELLRCRNIPERDAYLDVLCTDTNAYVKKRAQNAKEFLRLCSTGDGLREP